MSKTKQGAHKCSPLFTKVLNPIAEHLKTIVLIGGSIGTICAAIGVGFTWLSGQVTASVSEQISDLSVQISKLQETSDDGDKALHQGVTRVELLMLIRHTPQNGAEIERVAHYYFCDLGGDWYMSSLYSTWAAEYDGDNNILTSCHRGN